MDGWAWRLAWEIEQGTDLVAWTKRLLLVLLLHTCGKIGTWKPLDEAWLIIVFDFLSFFYRYFSDP